MSHTATAKCKMKCSVDILKKIIKNKLPKWEKSMVADAQGGITWYNFYGKVGGKDAYIVIPGRNNTKLNSGNQAEYVGSHDIAITLSEGTPQDGVWEFKSDNMEILNSYDQNMPVDYKNFSKIIEGEIPAMKIEEFVDSSGVSGLRQRKVSENGREVVFEIDGDVDIDELQRVANKLMF